MTSWTVGDYQFDANRNRLWGQGREILLEPKASALLAYFCQHPGRSIGRDELLEAVWHGRVVSDNSINRVIVLLRKALGDDGRVREYIATVPKVGYRLIAEVSAVDRAKAASSPPSVRTHRSMMLAAGVALAVACFVALAPEPTTPPPGPRAVAPLSRLPLTQWNGALANDGVALLYTASDGEHTRIFLDASPSDAPRPISAPGGDADFAEWSHDDRFIVYQFSAADRCEFHRLERTGFATGAAEVLYECVPGSYSELSLALNDKTLYFLERATPAAPYAAYALDLAQRAKRRLSQPVARGYGNHYVDVHPTRGTLLLLSDHLPGKTSVFELDPRTGSFALLRAFDYGLDSAVWSHRGGHIVHPSRHPSYQLLETSLDTDLSTVLVSDSRRIASPRRLRSSIESTGDYLFTSYLYNRDIELAKAEAMDVGLNSAVMDYLPALSNDGQRLAFVSKRAGHSQIWLAQTGTGKLQPIEPPDPGRRFLDLAWSADDQRLLANTNTGVLVYAVQSPSNRLLHEVAFELPAHAVRWRDARTFSFSHYQDGRWGAYEYDLDTGQVVALDPRWAFAVGDREHELWVDQSLVAWRDGEPVPALERCAHPVWRYQLRWRLDGQQLYCHAADAPADLWRFDAAMRATRLPNRVDRYEFFSVAAGQIANTHVASSHSDIMRTRGP